MIAHLADRLDGTHFGAGRCVSIIAAAREDQRRAAVEPAVHALTGEAGVPS